MIPQEADQTHIEYGFPVAQFGLLEHGDWRDRAVCCFVTAAKRPGGMFVDEISSEPQKGTNRVWFKLSFTPNEVPMYCLI